MCAPWQVELIVNNTYQYVKKLWFLFFTVLYLLQLMEKAIFQNNIYLSSVFISICLICDKKENKKIPEEILMYRVKERLKIGLATFPF